MEERFSEIPEVGTEIIKHNGIEAQKRRNDIIIIVRNKVVFFGYSKACLSCDIKSQQIVGKTEV